MNKILLAAAFLFSGVGQAVAVPVNWSLVNAQFSDGGYAFGSFTYDSQTKKLSNIDVYTTTGTNVTGRHYTATAGAWGDIPGSGVLAFSNVAGPDFTQAAWLRMDANINVNAAPGATVKLSLDTSSESFCTNAACSSAANELTNPGQVRRFTSGALVVASAVPEASMAQMSLLGLSGLAMVLARRRRADTSSQRSI